MDLILDKLFGSLKIFAMIGIKAQYLEQPNEEE